MTWHKLSPALLTLLVFLLAQGIGAILLFVTGMHVLHFSLIIMAVDILAVLGCHFLLHNIRFATVSDVASIRWHPGMLAIAGGFLGAVSVSILTDTVELPDAMLQTSLAMSRTPWGLLAIVLVGPVAEELLFREAIAGEMLRRGAGPWTAILLSSLAFSIVHLNLAQGLYALPLGILFGIIYYRTGNIILTSLLHILNNGLVVIQLYTLGEDIADISYTEWFGGAVPAYATMLCLGLLCTVLMRRFWDTYPPPTTEGRKDSLFDNQAETAC